jgi:ArsR family metal-binding transcriptional regulator
MLLHDYKFEISFPECNPFAQTVNAIAVLSKDISDVLPYLASVIAYCNYDDNTKTLTFRKEGKAVAVYSRQIAISKLKDKDEAKQVLEELKDMINITYENRHDIQPCYKKGGELKYLDVFKLLPGTNCKDCGEPTCLAFATRLVQQEVNIAQCSPLFSGQFEDKRNKLLGLLRNAGYEVPNSEYLNNSHIIDTIETPEREVD